MAQTNSYCRACSGVCGVTLDVKDNRVQSISGDPLNPNNAGYLCDVGQASVTLSEHPQRLRSPAKRVGTALVPSTWDEAISDIGKRIKEIGRKHGQRSLGILTGDNLAHNALGATRTAAFALGMGTPNLFSTLTLESAPLLYVAEQMLGHAAPLQADVGRAHVTILLGGDQEQAGWGPMQSGTIHLQAMRHFQQTRRQAKLIVVGSRKTSLAEEADQFISIRPGTELWFLLGMAHAISKGGWVDAQYLEDGFENLQTAQEWLEPWRPARCAEICGIEAEDISGVALKFSRAAMGTIARSPALTSSRNGTAAAWAWHVVHALTANLLRPGGVYESTGLVDLHPLVTAIPSHKAPRTRVGDHPSVLLQAPATRLADDILAPASDSMRSLVCIGADPLTLLPDPDRTREALKALELLVVIDGMDGPTTQLADWVLPATHFWEREDLHLIDQMVLPTRSLQATSAVLATPDQARPESDILKDLFEASNPGRWGGSWGPHLTLAGRWLATTDLRAQADRLLDWALNMKLDEVIAMPQGIDSGDIDRSTWRVSRPNGKVDLAPEILRDAITSLSDPTPFADHPFLLDTVSWTADTAPQWARKESHVSVTVHPSAGFKTGQQVRVVTPHGQLDLPVRLDEALRPDTIQIPYKHANNLVDAVHLDPHTATPQRTGIPAHLQQAD